MKNTLSMLLVLCALCGASFAGQVLTCNRPTDWRDYAFFKENEGALLIEKGGMYSSKNAFSIRASKKYKCTLKVRRAPGSAPSAFYLIYRPMNDEGRAIRMEMVTVVKGSNAVTVADAAKGATELKIKAKDPKTWSVQYGWCVALDAKDDYSDLPSTNLTTNIKAVKPQADGSLLITLRSGLRADVKAGTAVRIHAGGSNLYVIQVPKTPEQWTEYTGVVQGIMTEPNWSNKQFPMKTASACVAIMANWGTSNTQVEIKDLVIEELD